MFSNKRISIAIKGCIFLLVFIYSFAYCVKADLFFIKGDTRYTATKWVYDNVPKGSKIELFDQLNFVGFCKIMNDYRIVFLGRDSEEFNGEHFFKWNEIEGREEYLKRLNIVDSSSDYIIIDMHDTDKLYYSSFMFHLPGMAEYLRGLFEGKKNYKLVKKIEPRNKKIKNKNGIIMLENLWWDPVPAYRVTANTIYIFKRIRKDNV